jgi:hypothetical protein
MSDIKNWQMWILVFSWKLKIVKGCRLICRVVFYSSKYGTSWKQFRSKEKPDAYMPLYTSICHYMPLLAVLFIASCLNNWAITVYYSLHTNIKFIFLMISLLISFYATVSHLHNTDPPRVIKDKTYTYLTLCKNLSYLWFCEGWYEIVKHRDISNQKCHVGGLVEHTRLYFHTVAYTRYDETTECR